MILKPNKSLKFIKLLVCDTCIVIKSVFAQVEARVEVSIQTFVRHVISISHLLIKDRVVGQLQLLRLFKESVSISWMMLMRRTLR